MKDLIVTVKIYVISNIKLDLADIEFDMDFVIKNFKIPITDSLSELAMQAAQNLYPEYHYVSYEVLRYS